MKRRLGTFAVLAVFALSLAGCATSGPKGEVTDAKAEAELSATTPQAADSQDGGSSEAKSLEVAWEDGVPEPFGGADSLATPGDVHITQRSSGEYCLVLKMEYQNNSEDARNLINDPYCHIEAYQNGVQLVTPGVTSEKGIFDYNDSFTKVKGGATISTELVWVLKDTSSPVELEFGRGSDYKPLFLKTLTIG